MSTGKEIEKEVRVRRPPNSHFIPFPIPIEWLLLYQKGVIISQACGKAIGGVHRTLKGEEGGGRKLGEYRES